MSYTFNNNLAGRILTYPNIVPYDTDFLRQELYRVVDIANLAQAVIGLPVEFGGTLNGYASGICTQDSPNDMTVMIGVCNLWFQSQLESLAFGNVEPLTTPLIYKQYTNMEPINSSTLGTITAPSTSGQSQYYLIQGTPQTTQINMVSRPYYNASNPDAPSFVSANDTEVDQIEFALVAGTASATPTIPAPSSGAVGMFVILVTHGQTTITNANISGYPGSFINYTLPQLPYAMQNNQFNFASDTSGSANTIALPLNPIPSAYNLGMEFLGKIANTNTGATNINVSGLGNKNVVVFPSAAGEESLIGGELIADNIYEFSYDGTNAILMNPSLKMYGAGLLDTNSNTYANGTHQFTFSTVDYDPYSLTSSSEITPKRPGYYQINSGLGFSVGANAGGIGLTLYKNGSLFRPLQAQDVLATTNIFMEGSCIVHANGSTDTFAIYITNSTGATITEDTNGNYFQAVWLGN